MRTASFVRDSPALREVCELSAALEAVDFTGWDPFDALSAPAINFAARRRLGRRAAIQLFKRAPVNMRPLIRMRPQRHTKALALCVSAYSTLARLPGGDRFQPLAVDLAGQLAAKAVVDHGAIGWGYEFDVQTRWGFYSAGTPNAVVTAFAIQALLDTSTLADASSHFRELAASASRTVPDLFLVDSPQAPRFF